MNSEPISVPLTIPVEIAPPIKATLVENSPSILDFIIIGAFIAPPIKA